jgi:hypothetical protein
MAYEIDGPYVLTGPDGTRVVIGNGATARADTDWIGFLNPDDGITGLDSAEVRESADLLVEADGGVHGAFYRGRRPFTLNGWIDTNTDLATMSARADKLLRAVNAMRADGTLVWQESHRPQTGVWFRAAAGGVRIAGRIPKRFVLPLVSADDRIVGTTVNTATIVPGAASGIVGYTDPYSDPYGEDLDVSGQVIVVNSGTTGARPWFVIEGPIANPRLLNNTTGEEIRITYTLAAGQFLTVETHPARRSVLLGGTSSRWGAVDNANTAWWELAPGANDIRLLSLSFSSGAELTVNWRDTWP